MTTRALILIDVQNDYFPGGKFTLVGMDAAAAKARLVLNSARTAGDLIVHIRHEDPSTEAPFFAHGSDGAQIHTSLLPVPGEVVVTKQEINAFKDTDLKAHLDQAGITEVVIIGAMSHMCVDAASRAAADFGYVVTVIHDAVATRDLEFAGTVIPAAQVHGAFMSALAFAYAQVVSTDQFLAQ